VDVLDWARLPERFRQEIERQHVIIRAVASAENAPAKEGGWLNWTLRPIQPAAFFMELRRWMVDGIIGFDLAPPGALWYYLSTNAHFMP
jgi:hypothetical protein